MKILLCRNYGLFHKHICGSVIILGIRTKVFNIFDPLIVCARRTDSPFIISICVKYLSSMPKHLATCKEIPKTAKKVFFAQPAGREVHLTHDTVGARVSYFNRILVK